MDLLTFLIILTTSYLYSIKSYVLNVILFIKQNMLILYCLKFTVLFKFFSFGSALRNELLHEKSRTEHVIYILQYLICVPNALMSVMM